MTSLRLIIFAVLVVTSCKRDAPAEPPAAADEHRDETGHEPLPSHVTLSAADRERAGVKTFTVRRVALASTLTLSGELVAIPDKTAKLSSATAGRLESVSFNEGSVVRRGDVLATLRVPDIGRLRGSFSAATSRARATRANAERLKALRATGLGAEQALVDAEADARAQEAEATALGEQLAAIGVSADSAGFLVAIRAPLSGTVVARSAVIGQPVAPDDVLGTIVDLSQVWFLARVFEKDLARLSTGATAEVEVNAFPNEHFAASVDAVSHQLDPLARTLTARLSLANPTGRLRLGLFGRAHVGIAAAKESAPQLVVPRDAVVDVGGKNVVFVQAADGDFVVHDVTLGEAALGEVQVLAGVSEGESVVHQGAFTLKSLLLKSTLAEDD